MIISLHCLTVIVFFFISSEHIIRALGELIELLNVTNVSVTAIEKDAVMQMIKKIKARERALQNLILNIIHLH